MSQVLFWIFLSSSTNTKLQEKPQRTGCPDEKKALVTIGILGLTFGTSTFKRHLNKLGQIIEKFGRVVDLSEKSSVDSKHLRNWLKKNDFLYFQTLDNETQQLNPDAKTLLNILKQHKSRFEAKHSVLQNTLSKDKRPEYQGKGYLYYSTAYAKMLTGWNQFDQVIPSESADMFSRARNQIVRTVPIDYSVLRSPDGERRLEEIVRKLDGVIFTGGDSSFYGGVEVSEASARAKYSQMGGNQLIREYLKKLQNGGDRGPEELKKTPTAYFEGLSSVLKIVRKINREHGPRPRRIPVFAICLGFEGLLMNSGGLGLRLGFVSDKYVYHDISPTTGAARRLTEAGFGSFSDFIQNFYKNSRYFPGQGPKERNIYFNHTKMVSPKKFYSNVSLPDEFNVVAVSSVSDNGKAGSDFNDSRDWEAPQVQTPRTSPADEVELKRKIANHQKVYFNDRPPGIAGDIRFQQKLDVKLISGLLEMVRAELASGVTGELERNYQEFAKEADERLDELLTRKSERQYLEKLLNTDYADSEDEFVSVIESRHEPIFGVQFHIEKTLYNFHNNPAVKNSLTARLKDQMIAKFFLKKVFEEKIKALKTIAQEDSHALCERKTLKNLSRISRYNFGLCKFVPQFAKCAEDAFNRRFKFEWLCRVEAQGNERACRVGTPYNDNLAEQVIRDSDEFYQELAAARGRRAVLGPEARFVLRNIERETEIFVFRNFDKVGQDPNLDTDSK